MGVGDGKRVGEFDFVGKHVAEFGGIAATGREVRVPYCMVYELEGEKIRVLRPYMPMDVLLQQIGGVSSPEQSVEPSH
jgi:predicted ester cyclase